MSVPESKLEPPAVSATGLPREGARPRAGDPSRYYPAVLTGIGLLAIATVLVLWARTRPGFDPYGWLVWGHQTVVWALDTNAAPSWKPLPYLFTVPYALFGHDEMWLWLITAVAISLSGVIFAGRIAYRLTDGDGVPRHARIAAAAFAGATLLVITQYWHYILSAQSDPMIVALVLGRDRLPSLGPAPVGLRARSPGLAGAARGVAVPGALLDLGVAAGSLDAAADRRRGRRDPGAVVRDPGADLADAVRRRQQRHVLGASPHSQPGVRHDRPLSRPSRRWRSRCWRCSRWRSRSGGVTG